MKKVILAVLFLFSITGLSKNGVWEIVSAVSQSRNTEVRAVFVGDNKQLEKNGDSESPSGIFMDYLESSVTMGDGTDLTVIESKYKISDLKPGTAKVSYLNPSLKSAQLVAAVSKKYDQPSDYALMGLFNSYSYNDIKIYDKGNKTIVNYNNLYIIFEKGDADIVNASAWN